jgi:hypothetical protein
MEEETMVRRISVMFHGIFRTFVTIQGIMMGISVLNIIRSEGKDIRTNFWLFCILLMNFWIMMVFFMLLSMCMKICIHLVTHSGSLELLEGMMMFPMFMFTYSGEESEEEMMDAAVNESMNTPPAPPRNSPTLDKLLMMEVRWGSYAPTIQPTDAQKEEKCLICMHEISFSYPLTSGVVEPSCMCATLFHKKCLLEWFYFNEKEATTTDPAQVTCPSCRHVFTYVEQ